MKQCPRCARTYADDLSYCLEDGTPLVTAAPDEETVVRPGPTPTPAPPPQKSVKALVIGVVGTIVVVILWGGIKLGIWWLDHRTGANENANVNKPMAFTTASPTPTYNPLIPLNTPSPAPSASPSPVVPLISPGTYVFETTRAVGENKEHIATIKSRVSFNENGTYLQQTFITIPGKGVDDLLSEEEKGEYSQVDDLLTLTNRALHEWDPTNGGWQPWKAQARSTMREKVRNVTENTFQLYDSEQDEWFTFIRVISLGAL